MNPNKNPLAGNGKDGAFSARKTSPTMGKPAKAKAEDHGVAEKTGWSFREKTLVGIVLLLLIALPVFGILGIAIASLVSRNSPSQNSNAEVAENNKGEDALQKQALVKIGKAKENKEKAAKENEVKEKQESKEAAELRAKFGDEILKSEWAIQQGTKAFRETAGQSTTIRMESGRKVEKMLVALMARITEIVADSRIDGPSSRIFRDDLSGRFTNNLANTLTEIRADLANLAQVVAFKLILSQNSVDLVAGETKTLIVQVESNGKGGSVKFAVDKSDLASTGAKPLSVSVGVVPLSETSARIDFSAAKNEAAFEFSTFFFVTITGSDGKSSASNRIEVIVKSKVVATAKEMAKIPESVAKKGPGKKNGNSNTTKLPVLAGGPQPAYLQYVDGMRKTVVLTGLDDELCYIQGAFIQGTDLKLVQINTGFFVRNKENNKFIFVSNNNFIAGAKMPGSTETKGTITGKIGFATMTMPANFFEELAKTFSPDNPQHSPTQKMAIEFVQARMRMIAEDEAAGITSSSGGNTAGSSKTAKSGTPPASKTPSSHVIISGKLAAPKGTRVEINYSNDFVPFGNLLPNPNKHTDASGAFSIQCVRNKQITVWEYSNQKMPRQIWAGKADRDIVIP